MIKRHLPYLFFLVILAACAPTDQDSIAPEKVFVKYYGSQSSQRLYDIAQNDAGEYILFGTRKIDDGEEALTGSNFYLVRTDAAGNKLSDAVIDIDSTEDVAARIKVIPDGYLIVGSVAELDEALLPQARKLFWARLAPDFSIISSVTYSADDVIDDQASIEDEVIGTDIILTQNDSVLVLGVSDVAAANEQNKPLDQLNRQILVQKAGLNGGVRWTKTNGYLNSNEFATTIFENDDRSILIVGSASNVVHNSFSGTNICVLSFNQDMTSLNNSSIFGIPVDGEMSYNESPAKVYRTSPGFGTLVISGTSSFGPSSSPFIMAVSGGGSLISAQILEPNAPGNAFGRSVTRTLSNDYIVVGTIQNWVDQNGTPNNETDDFPKRDEIMFIRTDQFGETRPEFSKNFGTQNGNDEAVATLTTEDGSIVIGGTIDFGSGVSMFSLMKMNDEGVLKE